MVWLNDLDRWYLMEGYSEMDFCNRLPPRGAIVATMYVTMDDLRLESSTIHHQPHPKIVVIAWQTGLGPIES